MNDENWKRLKDDFPDLLKCGVYCGDGWFELIHDLLTEISRIAERDGLELVTERVAQKYGELRVYLNLEPPAIRQAIEEAEDKAIVTCEESGRPGVLCENERGWLCTLALDVAAERGYKPAKKLPPW